MEALTTTVPLEVVVEPEYVSGSLSGSLAVVVPVTTPVPALGAPGVANALGALLAVPIDTTTGTKVTPP